MCVQVRVECHNTRRCPYDRHSGTPPRCFPFARHFYHNIFNLCERTVDNLARECPYLETLSVNTVSSGACYEAFGPLTMYANDLGPGAGVDALEAAGHRFQYHYLTV